LISKRKGAIVLALLLVSNVVGIYAGSILQTNADQSSVFQNLKAYSLSHTTSPSTPVSNTSYAAATSFTAEFFVQIHYGTNHGYSVNQTLLRQGYTPDCVSWCLNGINYFMDPTTLITNTGRDFEQCVIYSASATACGTITIVASDTANQMGWSVSTATPIAGDTWGGGAGVACSSANLIVDANGLADTAGTVTFGAAGTTVTTSITKAFSITGTYTAVQAACLITEAHGGTHPNIYAESTFGPDSFISGDSLTGTWTVARS